MAEFKYTALSPDGSKEHGKITAEDKNAALALLHERGLSITQLKKISPWHGGVRWQLSTGQEKFRVNFCREMSLMLKAGIPIMEAVQIILSNAQGRRVSKLQPMADALTKGYSLSAAMQASKGCFSEFMIAMVKAGEVAGNVAEILLQLHVLLKKRQAAHEKLQTAMIYPAILILLSMLMIGFLLYQVLPIFAEVFADFGAELPWTTELLLNISSNFAVYGPAAVIILTGIYVLCRFGSSVERVAVKRDKFLLHIPVWGELCRQSEAGIFFTTLSMLTRSSIPLDHGLELMDRMGDNRYFSFMYGSMCRQLKQGAVLSECLEQQGIFSAMTINLVKAGERSGELSEMLAYVGSICQEEAELLSERVQVMAEPAVILCMGGVIGFIVMSTVLPILDLMNVF